MDVLDFPLSRLCYAAHTEDAVEVTRGGFAAWLSRQLDPKTRSDADLEGRLRAFRLQIKYAAGNDEPTMPWALLDPKTARPPEEPHLFRSNQH